MSLYVLENLIDNTLSIHKGWDETWDYARRLQGEVRVYEHPALYEASCFRCEWEPGCEIPKHKSYDILQFIHDNS